jgi:hypothetical protein
MKATLILSLLGTVGTCLGQGILNWPAFPPFTGRTNAVDISPFFGGGYAGQGNIGPTATSGLLYYYELLYNTSFSGDQAPVPGYAALFGGTWLDTGLTATNGSLVAGRLSPVNPNVASVVPWDNGTTNNILLVGWSANLGISWTVVSNELANWDDYYGSFAGQVFFGESDTGYLTPNPSSLGVGVLPFGGGPTQSGLPIYFGDPIQLYLLPTPEPITIVLVGWGGFSLLLFWRLPHRRP